MSVADEMELPPDPARTIEGLRDTGYTFETAVADIVDNSIAADASLVEIVVELGSDGSPFVLIVDNGTGMDRQTLIDAMRYGSPPRPNPKSLGKFGLGLKTASTSIAKQLTVTTRPTDGAEALTAEWDLDYVRESAKWVIRFPDPDVDDLDLLEDVSGGGSGTVVAWRKVDRMIRRYADPTGQHAQNAIDKAVDGLYDHLAVTYTRFLTRDEPITVRLNGKNVEPWDPFGRDFGSDMVLEESIPVEWSDGQESQFAIRAFVLPPRGELTREQEELARISSGAAGFYVFREDRCISPGGWLRMFREEPHYSLCRIEFSFGHDLDDAFHIDIKKSRIEMHVALAEALKQRIAPARHEANRRYRANQTKAAVAEGPSTHRVSNRAIKGMAGTLGANSRVVGMVDGKPEIENAQGRFIVNIPSHPAANPADVYVKAVESLQDGLLFSPSLDEGVKGVALNAGHEFYKKCYSSEQPEVVKQALDFLLWALVEAELAHTSPEDEETMQNLRILISSITRRLAVQLPESD